jgi:hypothetical protein
MSGEHRAVGNLQLFRERTHLFGVGTLSRKHDLKVRAGLFEQSGRAKNAVRVLFEILLSDEQEYVSAAESEPFTNSSFSQAGSVSQNS